MRTFNSLTRMAVFQLRALIRNKTAFFFNLVMPLAFMLVFGSIYNPSDMPVKVAVGLVDQDMGAVAQQVQVALAKDYTVTQGDETTLKEQLNKGKVKAVIILPTGLSAQASASRAPGGVRILFDQTSASSGQALGQLQQVIAGVDTAMRGAPPSVIAIPEGVSPNAKFNVFDYLMPGELVFMLLSAGLVSVGISLAQQRQSGTLRHLFSTPLSMPVWLASRVLANLLMGLLQVVILYGVGMAVFKLHLPENLLGTVFMVLLGATTTLGIGLTVGALAKNAETAYPVALIIYMILSFLGNVMMPLDDFGATIHLVMKFMPSYYMTHALRLVMMQGKGLVDVRFDIAVLVAVAVVTMSIATWRLRKQFVAV